MASERQGVSASFVIQTTPQELREIAAQMERAEMYGLPGQMVSAPLNHLLTLTYQPGPRPDLAETSGYRDQRPLDDLGLDL